MQPSTGSLQWTVVPHVGVVENFSGSSVDVCRALGHYSGRMLDAMNVPAQVAFFRTRYAQRRAPSIMCSVRSISTASPSTVWKTSNSAEQRPVQAVASVL